MSKGVKMTIHSFLNDNKMRMYNTLTSKNKKENG